jgi:hypothetical protein
VFLRTAAADRVYSLLPPQKREQLRNEKIEAHEINAAILGRGGPWLNARAYSVRCTNPCGRTIQKYRKLWDGETEKGDKKLEASARRCLMVCFRRTYSSSSKDASDKPRLRRVALTCPRSNGAVATWPQSSTPKQTDSESHANSLNCVFIGNICATRLLSLAIQRM